MIPNKLTVLIDKANKSQKECLLNLHYELTDIFQLDFNWRYGTAFYDFRKWLVYLNLLKNGKLELCFLQGSLLHSEFDILQTKGRKMVAGIELSSWSEYETKGLSIVIDRAKSLQMSLYGL